MRILLLIFLIMLLAGSSSADVALPGPVIGGWADSSSAVTATWSKTEVGSPLYIVNGLGFDATAGTHQWIYTNGMGYTHGTNGPSPSGSNPGAWMAFEFDKVYKLTQMWSWGYGTDGVWWILSLKTANLEYYDGTAWHSFGEVSFGHPDPALYYGGLVPFGHDTEIAFGGIHASKIVLNVTDNWGYADKTYAGLAEVRFFFIEGVNKATLPDPENGAINIHLDKVLKWVSGDLAAFHNIYIGTDFNDVNNAGPDVIAGDVNRNSRVNFFDLRILAEQWLQNPAGAQFSADINNDHIVDFLDFSMLANNWNKIGVFKGNRNTNSYNLESEYLEQNKTYYWRIDEVNGANTWKGDVWSFTTGNYAFNPVPYIERLELVATGLKTGDGGNEHGNNETRIIRSPFGIFTVYNIPSDTYNPGWQCSNPADPTTCNWNQEWRMAKRIGDNQWQEIYDGGWSGGVINLMKSPSNQIYMINWPNKLPKIQIFNPEGVFQQVYNIPGPWIETWYGYPGAGIDLNGNIVVLEISGLAGFGESGFLWSYFSSSDLQWHGGSTDTEFTQAYHFIFPAANGGFTLINTVDTPWENMGLCKPPWWWHACVFNYFTQWDKAGFSSALNGFKVREAFQVECEYVNSMAMESYKDLSGRTHSIYQYASNETGGTNQLRHAVVENGQVVADAALPSELGGTSARIIQDAGGRFYVIGNGSIYPAESEDGTILGEPVALDFQGHNVQVLYLAVPRGGVPVEDYIDGVFMESANTGPNDGKWYYFRIRIWD